MCGIAGIVDLAGRKPIAPEPVRAMAEAITHRGPDEDGFFERPGLSLASRRLSIVGLADGRQPISNEDGTVWVVFNGELFDFRQKREQLQAKGHTFRTSTDTEILPHLWEEYGEGMFEHLEGQFAFALWDSRDRSLIFARDRMGICPLYWAVVRDGDENLLLFGSEIKAILASGMLKAESDLLGLNHVFSFYAMPGPETCFKGVRSLLPGRFLRLRLDGSQSLPIGDGKAYWQVNFPDWGDERKLDGNPKQVIDEFECLLLAAVDRRLRADVPVVSYLSGGVDSSLIVALASKVLGRPIPTFTVSVNSAGLDERTEAVRLAEHLGCESIVVGCGDRDVVDNYPELTWAAEHPVIDTSSAAVLALAKSVRDHGYKVALTGEGADEWIAGYPWFKTFKMLNYLDVIPGLSMEVRRLGVRVMGQPRFSRTHIRRAGDAVGGHCGWIDMYSLMASSKPRFLKPEVWAQLSNIVPYEDLNLNPDTNRWHPFNRALQLGGRVMLSGHLLVGKGDRVAMNSSVETRYPFLDEKVWQFLAGLDPKWKLNGFKDKWILRRLAERWLPKEVANRRKAMFRAPMDSFHLAPGEGQAPDWVDRVLSREAIVKAGYFDPDAVETWRKRVGSMRQNLKRTSVEMGLVGVTATQLWHDTFIEKV